MLVIFSILATVLSGIWVFFLLTANEEDWRMAAFNKVLNNLEMIDKLTVKSAKNKAALEQYDGFLYSLAKIIYSDNSDKKISKLEKENQAIRNREVKTVSTMVIPGYSAQRRFLRLTQTGFFKKYVSSFTELSGKKNAVIRAKELLARLLSYPVIGLAAVMIVMVIAIALLGGFKGIFVGAMAAMLIIVAVYAQCDEVNDRLNKRRKAIARQFPDVTSKLALLVTSGMIMSEAWNETAYSKDSELHLEMRKTASELDNLVEPVQAYTNFIDRCSTRETAKLASAIIQNLSKGNAEIGHLLKELAAEAWNERRNTARKDGEKANSLLMIPTLLLFISILIVILVPAFSQM